MNSPVPPPLDPFTTLQETSSYHDAFATLNCKKYIKLDDKRDLLEYFLSSQPSSIFSRGELLVSAERLLALIKHSSHSDTEVKKKWNQVFCSDKLSLLYYLYETHVSTNSTSSRPQRSESSSNDKIKAFKR